MSKKLAGLTETSLKTILKKISSAESFVLKQAPDICKEIIFEGYLNAYIWFFVFLIISILSFYAGNQTKNVVGVLTGISLGTGLLIGSLYNVMQMITITFCPKLYLIREIMSILKGNSNE